MKIFISFLPLCVLSACYSNAKVVSREPAQIPDAGLVYVVDKGACYEINRSVCKLPIERLSELKSTHINCVKVVNACYCTTLPCEDGDTKKPEGEADTFIGT